LGLQRWSGFSWGRGDAAASGRPTTAPVEQRDIKFAVNAAGDIGPAEQVSVRPEINGKIEKLAVDISDQVKKGDLLFSLDDKELQNQRASNLTAIERARLELEQAEEAKAPPALRAGGGETGGASGRRPGGSGGSAPVGGARPASSR
jgi:multidrug efflux pump subunit AcrA (membrane-fusion protein)